MQSFARTMPNSSQRLTGRARGPDRRSKTARHLLEAAAVFALALPAQADELLRGIYVDRGTRAEFTPCRGKRALVVADGTPTQDLRARLRAVISRTGELPDPPRALFVEVLGTADARRVNITGLNHAYTEGLACRADPRRYAWRAFGNEPFWRLDADARGVRLQRAGEPDAFTAPPGPFAEADGRRRFRADTPRGTLEVALEPGVCRDSMVESLYGWRAEVNLRAPGAAEPQVLRGCAYPGLMR